MPNIKMPKFFKALTTSTKSKTTIPISTHPDFYRPKGNRFARKGRTRVRSMKGIAQRYFKRMDANAKGKFFGAGNSGKMKW
jgi:hypothetical protein